MQAWAHNKNNTVSGCRPPGYKLSRRGEDITKLVCQNKNARFNYFISEVVEAGMVLSGTEVKSLRLGKANLKDGFVRITNEEAFLHNMHISPYPFAAYGNHEPDRIRKLLLHKREIKRLMGKVKERGLTLIPVKVYFRDGKAKVEIALAKGKKLYDKREDLKRKAEKRDMERSIKKYK